MEKPDWNEPLAEAHARALDYLTGLPVRAVRADATLADLRATLGGALPDGPGDARSVIAALADAAGPGIMPTPSGRYFGFVVGGALPAALAADWLTAAWDQNAGLFALSPSAAVIEEVAGGWLLGLLGLPASAAAGFVTGGQQANVTCLAAARHEVLAAAGWNVESDGLAGAPPLRILAGAERHSTIDRAARFLGLGTSCITAVDADGQGRMRPDALRAALASVNPAGGPLIVCAQAGNVNTGAVDPLEEICRVAHEAGAWVHVDGAFGLWAAASPRLRALTAGAELADSWATDAHKWLNVPYDCGVAIVARPEALRAAMGTRASYLVHGTGGERDALNHNPEFSRRARGIPVYAALRALGRSGVAELVERCCALAARFAERLAAEPGIEILNEVVLNQVLVRFDDDDARTRETIARIQQEGTLWAGGTVWQGRAAMRLSVSNWSTDASDVEDSVAAIVRCARSAREPAAAQPPRT
jgi:glutamate/tyrosine decarboxylase-like PLP-dependent enzyme